MREGRGEQKRPSFLLQGYFGAVLTAARVKIEADLRVEHGGKRGPLGYNKD
jgi:hypothetical protein